LYCPEDGDSNKSQKGKEKKIQVKNEVGIACTGGMMLWEAGYNMLQQVSFSPGK